jgi:hypothetical protein
MLDTTLAFLAAELSAYLAAHSGTGAPEVRPERVVDSKGEPTVDDATLTLTLVNVEEERVFREQLPTHELVDGRNRVREPELKLNLHLLLTAHFGHYPEALKNLSLAMTFFQARSHFAAERYPALDPRIGRLSVELLSPTYEQLNQVWAFLGAKQLPSVLYRVRLLQLQDPEITAVVRPVTTVAATLGGR